MTDETEKTEKIASAGGQNERLVNALLPYLQHTCACSFHNCQQYSDGLDGQLVDCNCGLINTWRAYFE